MIDNLNLILPLLEFESEDDYYFLQILQRKKDRHLAPFKFGGSNNNSRLIKAYFVNSQEYLTSRYDEIKALCDLFQARAGICLNKRSYKSSSLQMMVRLAQSIQSTNYNNAKMWNNVSGTYHPIKDKRWILDVDEEMTPELAYDIVDFMQKVEPNKGDHKILAKIPSRNGLHIITSPFNIKNWNKEFPNIEIHKNNPTNLYIP